MTTLGAAVLSTGLLFSQTTTPGTRPSGSQGDPAARITMRINMLGTMLNLTESQKASATQIFTAAQTASEAQRTAMSTARQALTDAVKTNNTAGIDQAASAIGTATTQLTSIDAKAQAAFYALLTTEQKALYDESRRGGFGGPGGPGGPGGFGGPRGGNHAPGGAR